MPHRSRFICLGLALCLSASLFLNFEQSRANVIFQARQSALLRLLYEFHASFMTSNGIDPNAYRDALKKFKEKNSSFSEFVEFSDRQVNCTLSP